ncbi:MAG: hypothetical protein Q8P18_19885 [Pseudomonadota bacterium]|nr:hypothetical protein [Pseudomonadota bacterium]
MSWRSAVLVVAPLPGCAAEAPAAAAPELPDERLLLLEELGPPVLSTLDPGAAGTEARFTLASGAFAYDLDVHESGAVALAYTAPGADGGPGYDRSGIVSLQPDDTLLAVACRDASGVWCFFPAWSPDTSRVWFVAAGVDVGSGAEHALACVDAPGEPIREVVPWGTEPAVSADGARVAWVAVDPDTRRRSLVLGDRDGASPSTLVASGVMTDISQPFFSVDGEHVYFVVPTTLAVSFWERVMWERLVPSAQAHGSHDVPGDWWRVPTAGGPSEQITDLQTIQYDGRAHPDGRWFAAATREGVVLVDLETGEATSLLEIRAVRALDWLP